MNALDQAILKTVAYFDLFSYPLTPWEIWKWLFQQRATFVQVQDALKNSAALRDALSHQDGFFFLAGHEAHVHTRQSRYVLALRKYHIANRATRILSAIPFVRGVLVCNNLAYSNGTASSDIDVLLVIKAGRLWLSRFFITMVMHLRRWRRHHGKIANRLCLSFYVADSDAGVQFEPLLLKPLDPYFAYWFRKLVPLYVAPRTYEKILNNNPWVHQYLPNALPVAWAAGRSVDAQTHQAVQRFGEMLFTGELGNALNHLCRRFQLRLITSRKGSRLWQHTTDVVVNDDMLKFHENDRRTLYRDQWDALVTQRV